MRKPYLFTYSLLLFTFIFLPGCFKREKVPVKEIKEEPKVELFEKLPPEEKPRVSLTSRPDGRELTLKVENIKGFSSAEYELVYLTEGISRGVIGTVELGEGEESFSRKLLLGTCSRGVCRYDKNVTGGTLTIRFSNQKTYIFKKDFSLQKDSSGRFEVVMR